MDTSEPIAAADATAPRSPLPGNPEPRATSRYALWSIATVLALITVVLAAWFWLRPPVVIVRTLEPTVVDIVLAVVGRARPTNLVEIKSPNAGQIIRLMKDDGDAVAADEPMAVVRSSVEQAQNEADSARVVAASAELSRARLAFGRNETLASSGFIARAALDESRAALRAAEAGLSAAMAQARATAAKTGEFTIRAPMAGTVLVRPIDNGQVITPTTVLFQLGSRDGVEIQTDVDEAYADVLRPGMRARAALSGSKAIFAAHVIEISPRVDGTTGGRLVKLAPDTALQIPAGRSIDITIVVERRQRAIIVPRESVRNATTAPTTLIVDGENRLRSRSVAVAAWPSANAIIERGLNAGDRLVLAPADLEASDKVRPRERAPRANADMPATPPANPTAQE